MEFRQVVESRRSVRCFQDTRIEPAVIQSLIDLAISAPSARNAQPWEFFVLTGRARIDKLSERAGQWLMECSQEQPGELSLARCEHLAPPDVTLLYHAPALVLVASRSSDDQAVQDCCLVANTLVLAARDIGLGSCWIGSARPWFNLPEVKRELGIPAQDRIVAPVILGLPIEWPQAQTRKPAKVHWLSCDRTAADDN